MILALLLAAVLRFVWVDHESLWVDEATSVLQSRNSLGTLFHATAADNYPPLHNLVLWVFTHLFGQSELVVRLPSVLASLATVWLAGRIARRLYGERAEALAMLFVAIAPLHVMYAQEGRMYALLGATAAWSMLALLRWLERMTPGRTVAYVVATMLCLYTHYYAVFIVLAQNLFIAIERFRPGDHERPNLSRWIALQMITGLTFVPWLSIMLDRVGIIAADFWIKEPHPQLDAAKDYFSWAWPLALALILIAVLPRLALARLPLPTRAPAPEPAPSPTRAALFLGTWWLTTLLVPFALSFVIQPFFIIRYTLAATTAAFILVAGGLTRLALPTRWLAIAIIILVAGHIPGLRTYYDSERRPPWRDVAAIIQPTLASNDRVLSWPNYERVPLMFYLPWRTSIAQLPPLERLRGAEGEAFIAKQTAVRGRIWLVSRAGQDPDGLALIQRTLTKNRVLELSERRGNDVTVARYGAPSKPSPPEYNRQP